MLGSVLKFLLAFVTVVFMLIAWILSTLILKTIIGFIAGIGLSISGVLPTMSPDDIEMVYQVINVISLFITAHYTYKIFMKWYEKLRAKLDATDNGTENIVEIEN